MTFLSNGKVFLSRYKLHILSFIFVLLFTGATTVFAVYPGTQWQPGETLDPGAFDSNCIPGSSNCSVDIIFTEIERGIGAPSSTPSGTEAISYIDESIGDLYTWDGAVWNLISGGGGGTPAAPVNSVQFNNAGAFGGSANFIFDSALSRFLVGSGVGAVFDLNESTQQVAINVGTNGFIVNDTTGFTALDVNTANKIVTLGDVDGAIGGNNTLLTVDDTLQTIQAVTQTAGIGARMGVGLNGGALTWSDGSGDEYGFVASSSNGGTAYIRTGSTWYRWPSSNGSAGDVLTIDNGSTLAWETPEGSLWTLDNNNFYDDRSGNGLMTGDYNIFAGLGAGIDNTTGAQNIFFGTNSGRDNLSGSDNVFLGSAAGFATEDVSLSNFIGSNAGNGATNASYSNFIGSYAGNGAVNAYQSNFLGSGAGNGASAANHSNFLGNAAGAGATDASSSNFFGYQAGNGATDANDSNFFGQYAGISATAANDSNFLGRDAGYSADNANNSNFSGNSAGKDADNASSSNFLGASAGQSATDASYSNFIGSNTGYGAARSDHSNFVGQYAGFFATDAPFSNFIGASAGQGAAYSTRSNFIGYNAGQYNGSAGSEYANNSIFIGTNAGFKSGDLGLDNSTAGYSSILIGDESSTGGFENSIAIGYGATNTISGEFLVDDDYDYFNFNSVRYLMPSVIGNPGDVLTIIDDLTGELGWDPVSGGSTLDGAYDFGGAGSGRTITADAGAVLINGEDGFQVTGTFGSGDALNLSGDGTRLFFNPAKAAFRSGYVNSTQWDDVNVGAYSTAMGYGTIASGPRSSAFGNLTTASNSYATAMGAETIASGNFSTALGYLSTASGYGSTATGAGTLASSFYATAMGQSTVASGVASFSVGQGNTASGTASFAAGAGITVGGEYATAIGVNLVASRDYAMAFGRELNAASLAETVMGSYETSYTPAGATSWNTADRLFIIGNGTSGGDSDALTILKSGQTGIAIDNFEANTNGNPFQVGDGTTGILGYVDGVTGNWVAVSDRRTKTNIDDINYGLAELLQLRPVQYDFKRNGGHAIGFIAQEVMPIIPDVVFGDEKQYGIAYQAFAPVIVKSIQELDTNIKSIQEFTDQTFKDRLIAWLGDAMNGITHFFADRVQTKELCVEDVCVTRDQFLQIIENSGQESSGNGGGSSISPENPIEEVILEEQGGEGVIEEENPPVGGEETPVPEVVIEEETVPEPEAVEEFASEPVPEPTPEIPSEPAAL